MRRYLFFVLAGTLATAAGAGTVNWAVDPYWIWKSPVISGLTEFKPSVRDNIRIFKIGARRVRPEVVILGTSRADEGLDPQHPAFAGRRGFNLAAPAETYEESLNLFDWVTTEFGAKTVVLTLDFFAANAYGRIPADYRPDNSDRLHEVKLLLSLDTLVESARTVAEQKIERARAAEPGKYNNYREDGLRIVGNNKAREWGGHRNAFIAVETTMLNQVYLPLPKCAFAFEDAANARFPLRALSTLIAEAHRKGIDLRLAISPIHARLQEAIAAAGLWEQWEEWKRQIVAINDSAAGRARQPAYPLWDFSGYSAITTEPVPAINDADTRMNWYWESSHYKKETGDLVLDLMFGKMSTVDAALSKGFGVTLSGAMLDTHLRHIREGRAQFRKNFPADIDEVETSAANARAQRQTLGCKNV